MILRNKKLKTTSATAEISVSFSSADVRNWVKMYAYTFTKGRTSGSDYEYARTALMDEEDVRWYFEHEGRILLSWPTKWKEQLSAWAWAVAIREGFLKPSATPGHENEFYFADSMLHVPGRPKKER